MAWTFKGPFSNPPEEVSEYAKKSDNGSKLITQKKMLRKSFEDLLSLSREPEDQE